MDPLGTLKHCTVTVTAGATGARGKSHAGEGTVLLYIDLVRSLVDCECYA
jgi:hypothetical protein